jgi:hypothetical protein
MDNKQIATIKILYKTLINSNKTEIKNTNGKSIYALGAGGRGFESRYPDKKDKPLTIHFVGGFFFIYIFRAKSEGEIKWGHPQLSVS